MNIFPFSDLHIDFRKKGWNPLANHQIDSDTVIVAAGDIHDFRDVAKYLRKTFESNVILFVPGNHEYYSEHRDMRHIQDRMRLECETHDVVYLDNEEFVHDGVRFLGTTLWTDFRLLGEDKFVESIRASVDFMWDYRNIRVGVRTISPSDIIEFNKIAVMWLTRKLVEETPCEKTVVVTHHAPLEQCIAPRMLDAVSASFACHLPSLVELADLWIHGHNHTPSDFRHGKARVISNQYGYDNEGCVGFNGAGGLLVDRFFRNPISI